MVKKYIQQQHQQQLGVLLDLTAIAAGKDFRSRIWESHHHLQERLEWRWRGVLKKYFPNQSSVAAKNSKKVREEILAATPFFVHTVAARPATAAQQQQQKEQQQEGWICTAHFFAYFLHQFFCVYEW